MKRCTQDSQDACRVNRDENAHTSGNWDSDWSELSEWNFVSSGAFTGPACQWNDCCALVAYAKWQGMSICFSDFHALAGSPDFPSDCGDPSWYSCVTTTDPGCHNVNAGATDDGTCETYSVSKNTV